MTDALAPVVGNLAWVPDSTIDELDILDRFNGVPSLGLLSLGEAEQHLFWRLVGYVTKNVSGWLYVPVPTGVDPSEREPANLLDSLVFHSEVPRYATIGVAWDNRLIFDREWQLPPLTGGPEVVVEAMRFIGEAMHLALEQGLPPSRRMRIQQAVQELAAC